MENISTGLKWAIGLIVTLLIVAAGISVYMVSNGNFKRAQEQALSQSSSLSQTEFTVYDKTNVTGSDVLEAVKRYEGRPEFSILVDTGLTDTHYYPKGFDSCYKLPSGTAAFGATAVVTDDSCSTGTGTGTGTTVDYSTMTNRDEEEFVNTTARFEADIFRDGNGEVRLLRFTQKFNK